MENCYLPIFLSYREKKKGFCLEDGSASFLHFSCSNAQFVCWLRLVFTAIFSAPSVNIGNFSRLVHSPTKMLLELFVKLTTRNV